MWSDESVGELADQLEDAQKELKQLRTENEERKKLLSLLIIKWEKRSRRQ